MSTEDERSPTHRQCVDCRQLSPPVETGYTLISPAHGWRLTKAMVDGKRVMQWRCPSCHRDFRSRGSK